MRDRLSSFFGCLVPVPLVPPLPFLFHCRPCLRHTGFKRHALLLLVPPRAHRFAGRRRGLLLLYPIPIAYLNPLRHPFPIYINRGKWCDGIVMMNI